MAEDERERDDDRELLARALEASAPVVEVPPGFAAETAALATAQRTAGGVGPRARRGASRRTWGLVAIAAVLLLWIGVRLLVPANTPLLAEGDEIRVPADAREPVSAELGHRATVVLEPGTELAYDVGGWLRREPDVVQLRRGSVFFRIEEGGPFEVHTPAGRVRVTGTCFQVALRGDGDEETAMQGATKGRMRWFGAGAMSAALVVVVYEGGVRVANAEGRDEIAVAAGEAASVSADGDVQAIEAAPGLIASVGDAAGATAGGAIERPPGGSPPGSNAERAQAIALRTEVDRLRGVLERNAISPETGMPLAPGERRRGLNDDGDTDLTEDEWRTLAERGELRYRLVGGPHGSIRPSIAEAHQLTGDEVSRLDAIVAAAHERLSREIAALYREAVGSDPAGMSLQAMMMEIQDKTEEEAASRIRWVLAQERAGLMTAPPVGGEMLPYERMMRLLVAFENELEVAMAAVIGPQRAHEIIHGEHSMPAHAYGSMGRPNGN